MYINRGIGVSKSVEMAPIITEELAEVIAAGLVEFMTKGLAVSMAEGKGELITSGICIKMKELVY